MIQRAEISCKYEDESVSEAISASIQPDNLDSPDGVEADTRREGKWVKSEIEVEGDLKTLLATMDDLLACVSTAEKMI